MWLNGNTAGSTGYGSDVAGSPNISGDLSHKYRVPGHAVCGIAHAISKLAEIPKRI